MPKPTKGMQEDLLIWGIKTAVRNGFFVGKEYVSPDNYRYKMDIQMNIAGDRSYVELFMVPQYSGIGGKRKVTILVNGVKERVIWDREGD